MTEFATPIITELMPKPSNGIEWVEIYNPANQPINLNGWTLYDQLSQASLIYTFTDLNLPAQTTVVVEVGKKLNDSGDGVTLKNAAGTIIDTVSYTSAAQTDQSYARLSLAEQLFGWQNPTPNSPPIQVIPNSPTPLPTNAPSSTPTVTIQLTNTPKPTPTNKPTPTVKPSANPSSPPVSPNPTITTALQQRLSQATTTQNSPIAPEIWPSPILTAKTATNSSLATDLTTISPSPSSNLPTTRQVYFPDWRSPDALLNVIMGGLILMTYNGFLIWFDWQQSLLAEL